MSNPVIFAGNLDSGLGPGRPAASLMGLPQSCPPALYRHVVFAPHSACRAQITPAGQARLPPEALIALSSFTIGSLL